MNQSLSVSAGAGSLVSIGTVSAASADTVVKGVAGENSQAVQSFDQSMKQASQHHSSASVEQGQSGQTLPEGGEFLPSVGDFEEGVSSAMVVDSSTGAVGQVEAEGVIQGQLQQELFTAAGSSNRDESVTGSDGDSALQQINRYRGADLSVIADSALKQVGARSDSKAASAESNVEKFRARSSIEGVTASGVSAERAQVESGIVRGAISAPLATDSAPLASNAILSESVTPASGEGLVSQEVQPQQTVGLSDQNADQRKDSSTLASGSDDIAEKQLLASSLVESKSDFKPVASPVVTKVEQTIENRGSVEPGSIEGPGRPAVEEITVSTSVSDIAKSEEKSAEGVERQKQEPVKSLFAESVAQIVRESGLANAQQPDSPLPVAGSVGEAIRRLAVSAGGRSDIGAEAVKNEQSAKIDGGFSKVEPQQRTLQSELGVQQPIRQANDSVVQSGSALAGAQQVADNLRQQMKSGGESDKLSGLEVAGRSEGRQETLLTSFADSLAAVGKARATAEPMQMVMPEGVRPGVPAWSQAVHNRVMMMASQNGQFAEIQLDPPELGSLLVKLQIKNEQVNVVFTTPHGAVRDAIEQSMPRLREMLAEQGLDLAESSVHDQNEGQQRQRDAESESSFVGYQGASGDESSSEVMQQESLSLVDYYA